MAAWTLPARDGDFFYSEELYVDVGNNKHYARASIAELVALLRPDAPRLRSRGCRSDAELAAKDPAWHYYTAQLMHYDLPFTKAKNTAKVRLLDAINQSRLEVPRWIRVMERELENEWEDNVRNMSKREPSFSDEDSIVSDQFDVSFGNPTKARSSTKRKRARDDALGFTPAAKRAARIKAEGSPGTVIRKEPRSTSEATSVKQESKTHVKQEPGSPPMTTRVKQETEVHPDSSLVQREPSTPLRTSHIKPEVNSPSASSKRIVLSGLYHVSFVSEDGLDDDAYGIIELSRSPTTPQLWWANINWGPFNGLIRMYAGLDAIDVHGSTYIVTWRLRHMHTQAVAFGRNCTGEITFYPDQTFDGVLFRLPDVGNVHMRGRRTPWGSLEGDFQAEWDEFADDA
ncbi:hypothetical protein IQ07DRAFT_599032 [Pyrenochaeta sp. DS3sAY3a]|nr:hypothetical protein IQ07DRAFT_599032 [Pyrenochaeta sp. DS3sAY3a]